MHAFSVALGIVVLVLGLLDVFLTALNYEEAGFLATRLCALPWHCLRRITRRLAPGRAYYLFDRRPSGECRSTPFPAGSADGT